MTSPDPLSHLSPRHRRLFLEYGFGEHKSISHVSIIDAFRTHLQSTPGAAAVEYLGESITYQDLDRQSSQLAARLQQSGVRPGHRVVLLVKRSIPMVVGILGILKAGAAYVPLDGGIVPDTTLAHIISDANVQVILTLKAFAPRLVSYDVRSLLLDEVSPKMDVTGLSAAHDFTGLESAYIIYTSGTTGTPKGVDVTHRNVLNLVTNSPGDLGMKPGMRVSQLLNIAFDMAQWECLGSLVNGCTLCLRGSNWLDVLRTVDIVISTPSCLRKYTPTDFQPKVIATAGEPCPQVLADRWIASGTKYYNCCGPTETTIVNTIHEHTKLNQTLSIGRPTPNNNVYILDEEMKPVSIGDAGMIWAGGLGVARGYLNLPEKTADSFRPDVFANSGGMMYKTGDLGRWRTDGSKLLDILGRTDDQVKVKGFRVELDGVATAMEAAPGVHTAVALLIDEELVGVYAPDSADEKTVKMACTKVQPYYACPSRYVRLPEMPMTTNGKIDKKLVREIVSSSSSTSESLSGDSPTESSCPSTDSVSSDEEREPHIFSSVTKLAYDKVSPVTWESPSSFIPTRGRLFVNVVQQDGTTFSSRSSIFSRNHTPSVSRPASEIVATDEIPGAGVSATEGIELKGSNLADPSTHEARSTDSIVPQVLNADAPEDTSDIQKASTQTQVSKLMPSPGLTTSPSNLSVGSNSFDDRLLFAVPKKGRLHEKCMDMLRRADLQFTKPNRLDICIVKNLPIALVFLPASDIPRFVGESNVDIGITGQDVVLESGMQSLTKEMLRLGFGRCKLQVQVPEGSKIEREEDLAEKRIATSFEAVAGEHFGRIDARMGTKTKIEYLSGSVETACTLGLAEGIGTQRLILRLQLR
ncbi:hypothetical protein FS749_006211 [Ceratobasidium sp. UAMH 11750]|nr:hypothetical protein FS749_006211 [Ceratobasidium sp. UAMH 11750]